MFNFQQKQFTCDCKLAALEPASLEVTSDDCTQYKCTLINKIQYINKQIKFQVVFAITYIL